MNKESVKMIYKVGAPTILMQSFGSIMVGTMNMILVMFSTTAVAFFGVYFKLQSFLFMPMNGLGQGTLPIVGYNFGAGNIDRIKQAARTAIAFGCTIGLVGTIVFMCFTRQLLGLFSASEAMLAIGIPALRIISATFMLSSVTMVIGYIIAGLGNGTVNMFSAAIRQIIMLLPFVLLIGKVGGIAYVWYAFWISEVCAFAFAVYNMGKKLRSITNR
jgi:Na+-driven multidrug efflux pump